ncbi:unnamed protein product [Orchesella dallaii]|uniref:DUF4806 domain-containing protein n=1 Tax=Orchesella dallaii TaxID=48710 RepID=A0ABP1QWB3_9HEXA
MSNIFAVVENSCQCIPTNWLIKRNKFCLYPRVPAFKVNDLVKKLVKPRFDGSWQELEVRVLVYTDTYDKARRKTAAAQLTSTIETEDEFRTNLKRKGRTINYQRSSDEQISVADILPTPEGPLNSARIGEQDVQSDIPHLEFTATPSAPHFILAPGSGLEGSPGSHGERNVESSDLENQQFLIPEAHSSIQIVDAEVQVSDFPKTVLRIISILRASSRNSGFSTDNLAIPISLPITTEEEFLALGPKSTDVLKLIGGQTKEDVIRKLLQFAPIIGPALNSQLNFTGKFKKKKLQGTNLFEILKDTIRCTRVAAEATDSEIKSVVQRWLNRYKDRDGGRRHRQNETERRRVQKRYEGYLNQIRPNPNQDLPSYDDHFYMHNATELIII